MNQDELIKFLFFFFHFKKRRGNKQRSKLQPKWKNCCLFFLFTDAVRCLHSFTLFDAIERGTTEKKYIDTVGNQCFEFWPVFLSTVASLVVRFAFLQFECYFNFSEIFLQFPLNLLTCFFFLLIFSH